jgi:hypothetical protein
MDGSKTKMRSALTQERRRQPIVLQVAGCRYFQAIYISNIDDYGL